MTVLVETRKKLFTGTGITGPFTWTWRFLSNTHILVTKITTATGERVLLAEGDDYTLTGAMGYAGGSITTTAAVAVGEELEVKRDAPKLQNIDLRNQGDFFPETYEDALDAMTMGLQDIKGDLDDLESSQQSEALDVAIQGAAVSANNAAAAAIATAADRVQTGVDATATDADRVQTGLDAAATAADRVQTGVDAGQTVLDAAATAADRVQTGLDRTAAELSAANASGMGFLTKALMDAAAGSYTEGQVVRVTNDPDPALNGDWIKGATVFTPSSFDRVAVAEVRISSVEGKLSLLPSLISVTRDSTIKAENTVVAAAILDIKVYNAAEGKLYRLEWIGNGTTAIGGTTNHEMLFSQYDAATFATGSTASKVDLITLGAFPATTIPAGDIITREFTSAAGVVFRVTYRPAMLTPAVTSIALNDSALPGWSWVINPAKYTVTTPLPVASITPSLVQYKGTIDGNTGADYPLRKYVRDGVTSATLQAVNNAILDIRVMGVVTGKLYRLEWIGNGTTALPGGVPNHEMLFAQYDAATYSTDSAASKVDLITLGNIPATTIPAGDVITRDFVAANGITFRVTYRPSALLPVATSMAINYPGVAYSWIIDPVCYIQSVPDLSVTESSLSKDFVSRRAGSGAVVARRSAAGVLRLRWEYDATRDFQIEMTQYGANAILGMTKFGFVANAGVTVSPDMDAALVTTLQTTASDWIGPYQMKADTAEAVTGTFTGGAHGVNPDGSGTATARMLSLDVYVDGQTLPLDTVVIGNRVDILTVNRIQGKNTLVDLREILEETVHYSVSAGCVQVALDMEALEPLHISLYYGMQSVNTGFDSSIHFVRGSQSGRVAPATNPTSGAKSAYPNVDRWCLRGATGVNVIAWIDNAFGLGDRVANAAAIPNAFVSGGKTYSNLVNDSVAGIALALGDVKSWRGAYLFTAGLAHPAADLVAHWRDGEQSKYFIDFLAEGSGYAQALPGNINRPVTVDNADPAVSLPGTRSTAKGIMILSSGYGSAQVSIE